jgi:hypothetical protein
VETPTQSDQGYPEEQPDDVAPDSGHEPPKEGEDEGRDDAAERGDDGTATGNPRSAG